jgi:hypothetical protein
LLHELALLGAFAEVPEPLLYMRRLADFGSGIITWQRP